MKAIAYAKYGTADLLHVKEQPMPTPNDNEIRIKIHAVEVTKGDCEMRSFNFPVNWFWLPLRVAVGVLKPRNQVLGGYFSGEVDAIGNDVSKFKIKDQVFGASGFRLGAYAEYLCLPETFTIVPKPRNMSFEEAAAVPLGGLNALHFMRKANIQNGEKVLINGAGGSIGIFAVQIAKAMGAEVTVVDSSIKEAMLNKIGADHFIDYAKQDFTNCNNKYDVIFNMVAQSSYSKIVRSLNPKGRYLMGNPRFTDMIRSIFTSSFTDKIVTFAFAGEKRDELLVLKDMIEAGEVKSILDKVYSPEQAVAAHQRVETEQRLGIVVINITKF